MWIKPNTTMEASLSKGKNDLYRKFRPYFIGATEKEFRQYSLYGRDGYVSVNPSVEESVMDFLTHEIDEILPITGATGVGKTYLILYCLKTYYDIDHVQTNHPMLLPKGDYYDLVYYSDFNITEAAVLKDLTTLCLSKIKAMYHCILSAPQLGIEDSFDIENYIAHNKLEVDYYTEDNKDYEMALFQLASILTSPELPIRNVVFIFDDLESLLESQQFELMGNFLTLFENLKSKSHGKFCSKFLFSLRNNTYYNIYKQDFYNTHRASKNESVLVAPSLSQLFQKRFEIIFKSDQVKKAKNQATWATAQKILIDIADRVDSSYANLLLKLNNNNISRALDDFLSIISNRRWTQKNMNPTASFMIEAENYYINDVNILRILSMGERDIYYKTVTKPIRCILPNPGQSIKEDFIAFLVLQAFRYKSHDRLDDPSLSSQLLTAENLTRQIANCIILRTENNQSRESHIRKEIEDVVKAAFSYYAENRFIHKNVNPRSDTDIEGYYMLPRGEQIFDLFFSRSILFDIFRDEFLFDSQEYDVRCSIKMGFDALLCESFKYEQQLINYEEKLFKRITENKMWRTYVSMFGAWSISESFLTGINNSIRIYKKGDPISPEMDVQLQSLKNSVHGLTETIKMAHEEDDWF